MSAAWTRSEDTNNENEKKRSKVEFHRLSFEREDSMPNINSDDDEFLSTALDEVINEKKTEHNNEKEAVNKPRIEWEKPVDFIRGPRSGLSVTDLVNQFWCEQQFEYSYTHPIVKPTPDIVHTGSSIHLERELEVHEIVEVTVETKEDAWALKFLNCYQQLVALNQGEKIRELPIFGTLLQKDIFIRGIIDEIRVNGTGKIEVRELKTRSKRSTPTEAQHRKNELQVSIYRKLLDDLLMRKSGLAAIKEHVVLQWNQRLAEEIIKFSGELLVPCTTLVDTFLTLEKFIEMMEVREFASPIIEYCYQKDKETISRIECVYNEEWLEKTLTKQFRYLMGDRTPVGVEIEEAWKCHSCDYSEICSWRQRQENKCRSKNIVNFQA